MEFNCNLCNYSTNDKFNYSRHQKSKKHQEKVKQVPLISAIIPVQSSYISLEKYVCQFCNHSYTNAGNLSKHKQSCSEKSSYINTIKELKDQLSKKDVDIVKEIAHKDEIVKTKDEMILFLAHENKNLKTMLNCAGTVVEKSMSNLGYLNKHYPNAPALEYIKDIPDLHEDLSEDNVVDNIIYEYKNHTLTSFIGNLIIKDYKKTDPTQQSLWNSDADRLTYMIRSLLANESIQWEVDKKGINTTKYIIKPITDYIKKQLENYIKTCEVSRSQKTKKIMGSVYKMADCRIVIMSIDTGELAGGILKYISPYLYIVKDNQELL